MYHSFGVAAAEVELDCVTGERQLLRCDLMFDAGRSVSPGIDLGQVGAGFRGAGGYASRV
jgi:xanthine dehydrogenase molybdopterin-binding subunit B